MNNFWKNREVLITGAGGFVGSNAVDFLLKFKSNVTVLISHRNSKVDLKKKLGNNINKVKLLRSNLLNPIEADKSCVGIDTVLNFAAVDGGSDFKKNHSAEAFSQNIRITLNMLEAATKSKVKNFLLVSSSDIYTSKQENPITERDPTEINWKNNIDGYKLAKWTSELAAREFSRQYGMNIVIVRPSNLYGPRDNFEDKSKIRFIPSTIRKTFLDKEPVVLWGKGDQVRSFLYIDDFLKICSKLIEKGIFNKPINVASKKHITLKKLAQKIINMSQEEIELIIDSSKPGGARVRVFNLSLLESLIGKIKETDLDKGLKNTISYFRRLYGDHKNIE